MNLIILILSLLLPGKDTVLQASFGPEGHICSGVNIHFVSGHEKDLDIIAAAGIRFIRTDFVWQATEYEKGKYDWSAYDELTGNLEKRGLRAMYILDYSNSLYEDSVLSRDPITGQEIWDIAAPGSKESISAYTRWAVAAAKRYRKNNIVWEIWNEPNTGFWKPAADVRQYTVLALRTCSAVKSEVPESILIGPATSKIPFPFLDSFLVSGVLRYLDGVSVHPYRDYTLPPESAADQYRQLRELISRNTPADRETIPIVSSEWGYASCPGGLTEKKQAEYAVRMQLANLLCGLPVSIWYDWKNDGENPEDFEQNCGIVTYDLNPKLAFKAINTLNRQLGDLYLAHRIETESPDDYILLFVSSKGVFRICAWTLNTPHSVSIGLMPSHKGGITAADGYGKTYVPVVVQDELRVDLDELPKYITLTCGIRIN